MADDQATASGDAQMTLGFSDAGVSSRPKGKSAKTEAVKKKKKKKKTAVAESASSPKKKKKKKSKAADSEPVVKKSKAADAEPVKRKKSGSAKSKSGAVSAETMAKQQREISISEFFARNRHLLGFDNKRKALLTSVKEAVDNALDACEEGGFLPTIYLELRQLAEDRFRMICRDNGPGIVKHQIPNIFGKLLYGSKFHRLKMSRGQQGIGISAAGMYGLLTTGKPISVVSCTGKNSPAHHYKIAIDTKKNKPDIIHDDTTEVEWERGTHIEIEMVANLNKGKQSVFEYIEQTAIANPHAEIIFKTPSGEVLEYPRGIQENPPETSEIKPHPYGIELGTLMKMLKDTASRQVGAFLQSEFSRVSGTIAKQVCDKAGITANSWVASIDPPTAEKLYRALQETKLRAPSTNCLAPMGAETILTGLLKGVKAEFYTAATRPPSVYRGNPFQIEVGIAYGGQLGGSDITGESNGKGKSNGSDGSSMRIIRFANRVPLLYQQSACCTYKSVVDTRWNNYGISQARGALPQAPMVIAIHMASVWVPFTSESKEAIADYDEIRKEIKLGLAESSRRLGMYLRRKKRRTHHSQRRDVFHRYIDEVVSSCRAMFTFDKDSFKRDLVSLAEKATADADMEFDDHGQVIKKKTRDHMPNTVVLEPGEEPAVGQIALFAEEATGSGGGKKAKKAKKPKRVKKKK